MDPSLSAITIVMVHVGLIVTAGVLYLRRARVDRPPVGVFNGRDVLVVAGALVVIPPVYLAIPVPALAVFLAILSTAMLSFSLAPVIGGRAAFWAATSLVLVDVVLAGAGHAEPLFQLVNNLALGIVIAGVCNIWAQSGIRASHVALLACGLAVYDVIATLALPLMEEFVARIQSLPLAPMVAWGDGAKGAAIGLGDLLLVVVWTLVAERAFSRRAGLVAAGLGMSCVGALFMAFWLDLSNRPLPAMVLLGPAIAVHYVVLARSTERQRTTGEYLAAYSSSASLGSIFQKTNTPSASVAADTPIRYRESSSAGKRRS